MYDQKEWMKRIDQVIADGPYDATWESLQNYRVPEWYRAAKFGIFIHWGIYSVPAYGSEWYSRNMYIQGSREYEHHIETYGPQKEFGYKDFIPMFRAEKFNAEEWAELFKVLRQIVTIAKLLRVLTLTQKAMPTSLFIQASMRLKKAQTL